MKRVLAVVGAGLMIIVAILVRSAIDDDGGSGDGGDGNSSEPVRIVCVTELRDVCRALDNTEIADAGATVTALGTGDLDADAWLTFEPWPEIADIDQGTVVASTQLAVVIWKDREDELLQHACSGRITWRCLGEAGGRPWADIGSPLRGDVEIGLPPVSQASGLLLLGYAAAGYFGTTDYGTNDIAIDDAFAPWLRGITSGAADDDPLNRMLTVGKAAYAAVGTIGAKANHLGAHEDEVRILYPAPGATVRVVLAPAKGANVRAVERLAGSDDLRDALEDQGYDVPAAKATGLPDAGVLAAMRAL